MLPPASILGWRDGKITVEQYWDYVYQPESNIDDAFIELILSTPFEIIGLINTVAAALSNKFKKLRHRLRNVG